MSKYGVFSGPYFPTVRLNTGRDTSYLSAFSPNARKYGQEKTPYLDTFQTVLDNYVVCKNQEIDYKLIVDTSDVED